MKNRDLRDYLQDILDSIKDVENFTVNMKYEDFLKDKKTINAVIRSIEIIGEASKNLPPSLRNKYPSLPWKKIIGMRNKLIHEYAGIDFEILWQVVKKEVPSLEPEIRRIIKQIATSGKGY